MFRNFIENFKKGNFLIHLLLVVSILKEIVFSAITPIFHTPDEQAHFAQVAYFAEVGKMPRFGKDLNREIYESEGSLGTLRDEKGNNQFTFHPEYRIEYTNSLDGKYEQEIDTIPAEYRKQFIKYESANYPPLFYWISSIPYFLFYGTGLISRIYAVRFVSLMMNVLTIFISYLIAKEVFPRNKISQIVVPILVSFHPMLSFVSAGVSSDNLMNLLYSIFIYLCILLIKHGFNKKLLVYLVSTFLFLFLTKPQFILVIPTFIFASLIYLHYKRKVSGKGILSYIILSISIVAIIFYFVSYTQIFRSLQGLVYSQNYEIFIKTISLGSFIRFFKETIIHTIAEVIPWYWGVFNWLGVTYPRIVHQIINRLMILAAFGIIIKVFYIIRKGTIDGMLIFFLILSSLIYFSGITFYNFLFFQTSGFPFGIQGRYYFPTIVPHMIILYIGFIALIPKKFIKLKTEYFPKFLSFLMVVFSFVALWVIAQSYYELDNLQIFIMQVSQYKPWIYKGYFLISIFFIYITISLIFLIKFLNLTNQQKNSR